MHKVVVLTTARFFKRRMCYYQCLRNKFKNRKIIKVYLIHFRLACSRLAGQKKTFSMTNRKNNSFKRTLSQLLNIYTLDAIAFSNMVKFIMSSKHETLLSLHSFKN